MCCCQGAAPAAAPNETGCSRVEMWPEAAVHGEHLSPPTILSCEKIYIMSSGKWEKSVNQLILRDGCGNPWRGRKGVLAATGGARAPAAGCAGARGQGVRAMRLRRPHGACVFRAWKPQARTGNPLRVDPGCPEVRSAAGAACGTARDQAESRRKRLVHWREKA